MSAMLLSDGLAASVAAERILTLQIYSYKQKRAEAEAPAHSVLHHHVSLERIPESKLHDSRCTLDCTEGAKIRLRVS